MKTFLFFVVSICALGLSGCGQQQVAKGPSKGTLNLEGLTPEQQIAKVQADKTIPDRYKQLYINSVRTKEGLPSAPAGAPQGFNAGGAGR